MWCGWGTYWSSINRAPGAMIQHPMIRVCGFFELPNLQRMGESILRQRLGGDFLSVTWSAD